MMPLAPLMLALTLGQVDPYVRSRVDAGDTGTQCLFWTSNRVVWNQSTYGNPDTAGDSEFDAIRASFQSWQNIFAECGNLTLVEGPRVDERQVGYRRQGDNTNLVLFRTRDCNSVAPASDACWDDDTCANTHDCWDDDDNTIAITLTTYDERSGIIYDSDISFNAARFSFTTANGGTCFPPVTTHCVATDVQNTATHEVGHLIGLDHTRATGSTMNPSAPPGEVSKRVVDSGSRGFVCDAYPQGQASQSCLHPVTSIDLGPKAGGCSVAGPGGALSLVAVWSLWLARRRRREEAVQ
ncbi:MULTISPECIES: myxosortase-dependent metalloprotease, MXAN_2677/MXAN_2678 family [unclassified Myxococcus]|uniref:myxosortase-dependent metalloprotease, MXAN_2677/MXAN_2678 family n=1 Tax=Myxococcus TaxID=32 RepID=UPI0011437248|nr:MULTISPECIES: myxosortase-dependent metalloprotease, MXAN_2677/MXAN_2678 family [unclassified Myxococcus]NOK02651.1 matrixin family metalloprotease [Myxococcus xanthus]